MHYSLSDTITALSTPPGVGAIGVIRLSGPKAVEIVDDVFEGKNLAEQPTHTAHFGTIKGADGKPLDEVVVTLFRAPRSYTREDVVEVSCHGSPYILQQVLQLFIEKGARMAQPGEFTLRAFLKGRMDLSQAEAVADLIASDSAAAHQIAMQQMRGGFSHEIQRLREELINFASLIELELDFGEEDVEFADRSDLKELIGKIQKLLHVLIQSFQLGNVLKHGVNTVLAGRPNAGKSTLLNALLNEERAIVSDIAGTTRDTIEEVLNIRGVQFRLIDTAGIREAQDQIEALGVQRTMEKIQQAAILVYLWDVTAMTLAEVHGDLANLGPKLPAEVRDRLSPEGEGSRIAAKMKILVVCNKMDQNPYFNPEWLIDPAAPGVYPYLQSDPPAQNRIGLTQDQVITLSAKNGMNIAYLKEKLFELAIGEDVPRESTVVTNARHYDALQRADQALGDVLTGLDSGVTGDFIAMDIRRALNFLGEITGEIGVEDLLGAIFSRFCIGK